MIHTSYFHIQLDTPQLAKLLADITPQLAAISDQYDVLAFTGTSGLLVGPPLALALNKGMLVVRKKESSHSKETVEGFMSNNLRYLIVDDFMESGETVERIIDEVDKVVSIRYNRPTCVGVVMYRWTKGQIEYFIKSCQNDSFPITDKHILIGRENW